MNSRRTFAASLLLAAIPFMAPAGSGSVLSLPQDPQAASQGAQERKELGPGPRWRAGQPGS